MSEDKQHIKWLTGLETDDNDTINLFDILNKNMNEACAKGGLHNVLNACAPVLTSATILVARQLTRIADALEKGIEPLWKIANPTIVVEPDGKMRFLKDDDDSNCIHCGEKERKMGKIEELLRRRIYHLLQDIKKLNTGKNKLNREKLELLRLLKAKATGFDPVYRDSDYVAQGILKEYKSYLKQRAKKLKGRG